MGYRLRPYTEDDMQRIVELINQVNSMPTTVERFRWGEDHREKDEPFHRLMAEDETGRVVGYGVASMPRTSPKGWWGLRVVVEPASRGRGAGRTVYEAVAKIAVDAGALRLEGNVRDDDAHSMAWLERRGYVKEHHMFESTLDVTNFDPGAWTGEAAKTEKMGISLVPFGRNRSEEEVNNLYDLAMALFHHMPGVEGRQSPSQRQWRDWVLNSPEADPDGTFIAVDGDRWVGLTGCIFRQGSDAYTWFTGTLPEYRGNGTALALKLVCIAYVKQRGWKRMRTNNHSKNPGMLRINEKLGYQPEPGTYQVYKQF